MSSPRFTSCVACTAPDDELLLSDRIDPSSTFSCAGRSAIPERSALSIHDLGRVVGQQSFRNNSSGDQQNRMKPLIGERMDELAGEKTTLELVTSADAKISAVASCPAKLTQARLRRHDSRIRYHPSLLLLTVNLSGSTSDVSGEGVFSYMRLRAKKIAFSIWRRTFDSLKLCRFASSVMVAPVVIRSIANSKQCRS